jgi:hypothetical protein
MAWNEPAGQSSAWFNQWRRSSLFAFASIPIEFSNRFSNAGSALERYIYNKKVEELDYQLWLKNNAKFSSRFQEPQENYCPRDQAFSKYSESAPWLEQIPSVIRRNGCSRFRSAMAKWGKGGGRPQPKTRKSVRSVLLTSECFTIRTRDGEDCLFIGTKSNNLGILKWVCHCEYNEPRQISITHEPDEKWFVGFSFESGRMLPETIITEHADVAGGINVRDRAFRKITEISPGTSFKNARAFKSPRKGQPVVLV